MYIPRQLQLAEFKSPIHLQIHVHVSKFKKLSWWGQTSQQSLDGAVLSLLVHVAVTVVPGGPNSSIPLTCFIPVKFRAVQMAHKHKGLSYHVHVWGAHTHTNRHTPLIITLTHTHTHTHYWITLTKLLHYVRWKNTRCKRSPKNIRKFL